MTSPPSIFFHAPAIRVEQPLGDFYVTRIPAEILLKVAYSHPASIVESSSRLMPYGLTGSQRTEKPSRLKDIGKFINSTEAAFPNSIILGANYLPTGEHLDDKDRRWRVESLKPRSECLKLIIPTEMLAAAIVDGQHRLHAFEFAREDRRSMQLLCVVYLDLPDAYQAFLFATINFNQQKVDRSLAYELFGFNLDEEPPDSWSPEKAAVFFCRKLNTDSESPLYQHIKVAAENDEILFADAVLDPEENAWQVSTAAVVDGILKLISEKPKNDKSEMHQLSIKEGRSRSTLKHDKSPLRSLYLANNDLAIYISVKNFFTAVNEVLWSRASKRSSIWKTVGVQGLFDVLHRLLKNFDAEKKISKSYFMNLLRPLAMLNFEDHFFQLSGLGRARLRRTMLFSLGLIAESELPEEDLPSYRRLANKGG